MKLNELRVGDIFWFLEWCPGHLWEYRGSGWYSSPAGSDGGPWHVYGNPDVYWVKDPVEAGGAPS